MRDALPTVRPAAGTWPQKDTTCRLFATTSEAIAARLGAFALCAGDLLFDTSVEPIGEYLVACGLNYFWS